MTRRKERCEMLGLSAEAMQRRRGTCMGSTEAEQKKQANGGGSLHWFIQFGLVISFFVCSCLT